MQCCGAKCASPRASTTHDEKQYCYHIQLNKSDFNKCRGAIEWG